MPSRLVFPWRHRIVPASKVIPLDNSNDPAIASMAKLIAADKSVDLVDRYL